MKNRESKQTNRKALIIFILLLIGAFIVGGVGGYFSAQLSLADFSEKMRKAAGFFGMWVAPWLLLAVAVVMPLVSFLLYRKANQKLSTWDGEKEEISDAVERKISCVLLLGSTAMILSDFLTAAVYSGGFTILDEPKSATLFLMSVVCFLAILIEVLVIQQKCLKITKKLNPEKEGNVYDMKFQKKWLDSCDEAERLLIGKCAYRAYTATSSLCSSLVGVLSIGALLFDIGFLPALVVCVIWMVNLLVYYRESMKYSKSGNKLRK